MDTNNILSQILDNGSIDALTKFTDQEHENFIHSLNSAPALKQELTDNQINTFKDYALSLSNDKFLKLWKVMAKANTLNTIKLHRYVNMKIVAAVTDEEALSKVVSKG